MYLPIELVRLIISYARPIRPYIHELKYYFIYHKTAQIKFSYDEVETFNLNNEFEYECIITETISYKYNLPVYEKGYIDEIKNLGISG
tara:strand:+ start:238 stop:501 length:264 start_codon:yes stop_codon:yes gene_type:complete